MSTCLPGRACYRIMRAFLVVSFVLTVGAQITHAERTWAPGVTPSGKGATNLPPLVLRAGATFASDNVSDHFDVDNTTYSGLQLEAGIRLLSKPLGSMVNFSLDVPLVLSLLQGRSSGGGTAVGLIGRGIPTARLGVTLSSGLVLSPFAGFGAGTNVNVSRSIAENFQLVRVYRIGADVMFSNRLGAGIAYTRNTMGDLRTGYWVEDEFGGYWVSQSSDLVLKELSLSIVVTF